MPADDAFVVLASNFGREHPPAWWLNLAAAPTASVLLAGRRIPVTARELQGEERLSVLRDAVGYNRQWREYAQTLERPVPVVRLEPVTSA